MLKLKVTQKAGSETREIITLEGRSVLEAIKNIQDEDISNDIYRRADERLGNVTTEFDDVDWPLDPDSDLGKRYASELEKHLHDAFDDFIAGNGYQLGDME